MQYKKFQDLCSDAYKAENEGNVDELLTISNKLLDLDVEDYGSVPVMIGEKIRRYIDSYVEHYGADLDIHARAALVPLALKGMWEAVHDARKNPHDLEKAKALFPRTAIKRAADNLLKDVAGGPA